mmetsp:Transcript_28527/g.69478  ORF Transcript_28527/g.69478 Transcript_28527/m.69478 type:complete len:420 (-) Transcript_28527:70-1329(-)
MDAGMARLRAETLIARWLKERPAAGAIAAPCNSSLFGDERSTLCSAFCKPTKATNHCKWCKCKACSWCQVGSLGAAHNSAERISSASTGPLQPGIPFAAAVTSVFLPHLNTILAQGYPINLFSRPRTYQTPRDLSRPATSRQFQPFMTRAYYNGAGVRPQLQFVEWIDLDVVQPWAGVFVLEQRRSNSSVQRAYRKRRYTCVAPAVDLSTCSDVFTVYKVASIFDAVQARAAQYLIWVDLDTFFQRPLDSAFWRWTTKYSVVTIGARPPHNPETGIIFLNVARTQELVWLARNAYSNTRYQALIGGVNDVQVFGFLLARMVDVGWFAVGCRSSVSADRKASRSWLADSVAYDPHGYQYCPSEASSKSQVSPFNLLEYITHLKNHSGPTGRQLPGIHGAGMASHFCLLAGRNRSLMCNRG